MTADPVRGLLAAQVAAWNRGDLDAFCDLCTRDVVYVGAAGILRGREEVREGYRARYADRTAMGTLALEVLSVEDRGETAVAVVRWAVTTDRAHGGHALLVIVRGPEGWRLAWDATIAGAIAV